MSPARANPLDPDLDTLFQRHAALSGEMTPPESRHMLPREALCGDDIRFFALRVEGGAVAMGAVKRLDAAHGEVKSMHVLAEARGRGAGRAMLTRLISEARDMGLRRLSLETGSTENFAPARALYAATGFSECAPFAAYRLDPNSVFMTRALDA